MNPLGWIVVIIILLIVGIIAYSFFADAFDKLFAKLTATRQAALQKPQVTPTETICDLHVFVYGELNEDIGKPLYIKLGQGTKHPEIFKAFWTDCADVSPFSWSDLTKTLNLDQLALIVCFNCDEKISQQIVLRDLANPSKKFDANTPGYEHLYYEHKLKNGFLPTPFDLYHEFYVQDIPDRNYKLEIYYGRQLSLDDGKTLEEAGLNPYISKICKRNTVC